MNFGRINDPVIDKLLDQGRSEIDPAKRKTIYENLNREFATQGLEHLALVHALGGRRDAQRPRHPRPGSARRRGKPFTGLATGHPVLGMWISR